LSSGDRAADGTGTGPDGGSGTLTSQTLAEPGSSSLSLSGAWLGHNAPDGLFGNPMARCRAVFTAVTGGQAKAAAHQDARTHRSLVRSTRIGARPANALMEVAVGGFRKFLMRGNLIDLAVAVVIGVAFNAVVQALIADLITPLLGAIGKVNFAGLSVSLRGSKFLYGAFINSLLSFVVIALVVYFLIVAPATRATAYANRKNEATERACPECLSTIPVAAKRCMYCTSVVEPPAQPAAQPG
jgi:large conductance mechanosensitive channel